MLAIAKFLVDFRNYFMCDQAQRYDIVVVVVVVTVTTIYTGWLIKKCPQFSALKKTHVVSLGRIALAVR